MATQAEIIAQTRHEFDLNFKPIYIRVQDRHGNARGLRIRPSEFGICVESTDLAAPLTLTTTGVNQIIVEP